MRSTVGVNYPSPARGGLGRVGGAEVRVVRSKRLKTTLNRWSRKLHRWGSIATAAPLAVILCTGVMLQLKKQIGWIQPPTAEAEPGPLRISVDELVAAVCSVEEVGAAGWGDIERVDFRPRDGVVKVQCEGDWEVQVCASTGTVLRHAVRRSDLIESLHDGSWFHEWAKLLVFLPSGVVLLALWATGMWLWVMPYLRRR